MIHVAVLGYGTVGSGVLEVFRMNQEKIDRYDTAKIYPKLRVWLSNMVQRHKMNYLLFPEYHKPRPGETECAIHFHMLANADGLNLSDSGKQTKNGQAIFNLSGWKYGFSTAIELDGRPAIIKYIDYASFEGQEYTIPGTGMRVKYKTFNLDWDEGELPHEPS